MKYKSDCAVNILDIILCIFYKDYKRYAKCTIFDTWCHSINRPPTLLLSTDLITRLFITFFDGYIPLWTNNPCISQIILSGITS